MEFPRNIMVNCTAMNIEGWFENPMPKKKKGQKPSAVSKQQAIEQATSRVSDLFEVAPGRWCYHIWSDVEDAWIPALHSDQHAVARRKRASSIAAMAAGTLLSNGSAAEDSDLTWEIVALAYGPDSTGTVRERVERILEGLS